LIGQRSFGKGLVQNTKELGYNSRLKLTTSKYYIPSGRCIQGVEYENGEPKDIQDHLRSKFKTKNGRIVLDGGGIAPDIKMPAKQVFPITKALLDQFIIFDYVNSFCTGKDSIDSVEKFKFNAFQDFIDFTKKKAFSYQLESEILLQKMKLEIEKSPSTKDLGGDIKKMEDKISNSKKNDFDNAKTQIIEEIEKEIITRFYFQKGKVQHRLNNDPEVKEAISILSDTNKYKSILLRK
jgi:carboxyl-terminal processing protease